MSSWTDGVELKIRNAVQETLRAHTAEVASEYQARRAADRKARSKSPKQPKAGWTEQYTLKVKHEPVGYGAGRDCHITIEGSSRRFHIQQNGSYPLVNRWNTRKKPDYPPKWYVYVYDRDANGAETYDAAELGDHTNFESLVQQCICMMVGHAYYEASL